MLRRSPLRYLLHRLSTAPAAGLAVASAGARIHGMRDDKPKKENEDEAKRCSAFRSRS